MPPSKKSSSPAASAASLFVSDKGLQYRRVGAAPDATEIGTDEAGRGPLFGRTYAAAVVLPPLETLSADARAVLARARDSKTVPKSQMAALAADIRRVVRFSAVCFAEPEEIDRLNIRQAVLQAMRSAIAEVHAALPPGTGSVYVLADGTDLATYELEVVAEPKADARYVSVACASILAKAAHDAHILELCAAHPELDARYALRKNMGYGTAAHLAGLAQFGPSPWHRRSFRPISGGAAAAAADDALGTKEAAATLEEASAASAARGAEEEQETAAVVLMQEEETAKAPKMKRRRKAVPSSPPVSTAVVATEEEEEEELVPTNKKNRRKKAAADASTEAPLPPPPPPLPPLPPAAAETTHVSPVVGEEEPAPFIDWDGKTVVPPGPPPPRTAPRPFPPAPTAPPQVACDVRVNPETDVLVLRTPQVGTLHKVFNAMKELMADLTVIVDRAEGAVTIDGYHRLLGYCVSTVLRFEQQICRCPKLTFTVPASSFYTMLTKASPKHTMYLFVPQSSFVNGNVDYIHFQFETPAAVGGMDAAPTRVFTISLPTLNDPEQDNLQLPPIAYPIRVTLLSAQFSKDMRDLAEIGGENLQIEIRGGDCYFSSVLQTGATLGGRIHYPDICAASEPETAAEETDALVVCERYPLKTIKRIIKCSTLSTDVVIGVCAGMPLSIYYPIGADLGDMNVYITYAR